LTEIDDFSDGEGLYNCMAVWVTGDGFADIQERHTKLFE
jgi:hypothetical protein